MGGYLLTNRLVLGEYDLFKGIGVFKKRKQEITFHYKNEDFELYVFSKIGNHNLDNVFVDGKDFIVVVGSCIYCGELAIEQLPEILTEFRKGIYNLNKYRGSYNVITFINGALAIFSDDNGLYQSYSYHDMSIISNSFLALRKGMPSIDINEYQAIDYILNGTYFSDETIIKNVIRNNFENGYYSDNNKQIDIIPRKKVKTRNLGEICSFFNESLFHFGISVIEKLFCPITAGYDSRLILSNLMKKGYVPSLFIVRKDGSLDGEIAEIIARDFGLHLNLITPKKEIDEVDLVNNYYLYDGLGVGGAFRELSGLDVFKNVPSNKVVLDGKAGEIFRNYKNFSFYGQSIKSYIEQSFSKGKELIGDKYDKGYNKYLYNNISKIVRLKLLKRVTFRQTYILYNQLFIRYWVGSWNSVANFFNYTYNPFCERDIRESSVDISYLSKLDGKIESKLISNANLKLSKYNSNYGKPFNKFYIKSYLKNFLFSNVPSSLVLSIRKIRGVNTKLINSPYEIELYKDIFNNITKNQDVTFIHKLNIENVSNPILMSRILTLELFISNRI